MILYPLVKMCCPLCQQIFICEIENLSSVKEGDKVDACCSACNKLGEKIVLDVLEN